MILELGSKFTNLVKFILETHSKNLIILYFVFFLQIIKTSMILLKNMKKDKILKTWAYYFILLKIINIFFSDNK